ncbi:hypothetical protein AAG570_006208 [Ranatra chinensis]|uniref:Uncharacterized protein n=1 Tax=Ranatra chinensis TaxID=642074 RepID=A0ABD0Z652_9HEMI
MALIPMCRSGGVRRSRDRRSTPDDLLLATQPPNTGNFTRARQKSQQNKPHKIRTKALSGRPRASHEVCRFEPTCTPHSARRRGPRASPVYLGREGGGRHWALASPLSRARGGGAVPPPLLYPAAIRHSHYLRYRFFNIHQPFEFRMVSDHRKLKAFDVWSKLFDRPHNPETFLLCRGIISFPLGPRPAGVGDISSCEGAGKLITESTLSGSTRISASSTKLPRYFNLEKVALFPAEGKTGISKFGKNFFQVRQVLIKLSRTY